MLVLRSFEDHKTSLVNTHKFLLGVAVSNLTDTGKATPLRQDT